MVGDVTVSRESAWVDGVPEHSMNEIDVSSRMDCDSQSFASIAASDSAKERNEGRSNSIIQLRQIR